MGLNISSLFLKIIKYLSTQHFRYFIPMESIYNHDGFSSFVSALKCVSISLCEAQALRCEVSSRSSSRMMQVSLSWASAEILAGGASLTSRLLFSVCKRYNANRPSQNAFYPFYTTKKIPHESTRSVRIFCNRIEVELYVSLQKRCTFSHPLQLLLN